MRLAGAVSLFGRLSTPEVRRRALLVGGLVLGERLLTPAAAWALFGAPLPEKVAFGVALGCVFSARTYLQHALRARTHAELLERIVRALMNGNVLRANILPDEDAQSELGQAAYHTTQSISQELPLLFADGVAAAMLAAVVVVREPFRLVAITVGMAFIAGAVFLAARRSMEAALQAAWAAQQRVYAEFVDALEGRLEIVAAGRRAALLERFHQSAQVWADAGRRLASEGLVTGRLPFLAITVAVGIALTVLGARERGTFGLGAANVALLASMTPAFLGMAQGLLATTRSERWLWMIARIFAEPPADRGGNRPPPALPTTIAFENVSFRYEGMSNDALEDLSLSWEPGEVLALAGANGSGKSTCLRLLLALARPRTGAITVGREPLHAIDADAWRGRMAFLPQRPYLPPRSDVRTAVRFLASEATDREIRDALDRVGLLAVLERGGTDPLAVRIDTLSIGQRQRVGLTRMLCQRAPIVLLDEPDANLDRASIALVADLVRELARTAMVAVVAHSPELLDAAHRVIVLEQGRIVGEQAPARRAVP